MSVTLIIGSAKPETTKLAQYMDQLCHSMSKNSDSVTTKVRAGRNRELVTVNCCTPTCSTGFKKCGSATGASVSRARPQTNSSPESMPWSNTTPGSRND